MIVLIAILCVLVGAGLTYLLLRNKLKSVAQVDNEIFKKNAEAALKNKSLNKEKTELDTKIKKLYSEYFDLISQNSNLNKEISEKKEKLEQTYSTATTQAQTAMDRELERISQEFQKAKEDCHKEYQKAIADYNFDMASKMVKKEEEYRNLALKIEEARKISDAAVEANKRAVEMETQKDFYKLILSNEDKEEIKKLRSIIPFLRNAEPLNKVIWKVYYEHPYTDLIGRVVGAGAHTGIYKITNLNNGMCYVGQAVNISDRWKQHIKRGIGAEPATRNKLYPAMLAAGVENFSFEIIEECDRSQLNEREDYWQIFFKAKEFGYSIK